MYKISNNLYCCTCDGLLFAENSRATLRGVANETAPRNDMTRAGDWRSK